MKLLICTQVIDRNDPILGFFHGWVLEFAKHFEHIDVICLREGVHNLPAHVHVYSLGKEGGENRLKYVFRFYYFFSKCFFSGKIDYVFFHMGAIYNILAAPFFLLRKLKGTKFYWWKAHGRINFLGTFALRCVDRVYTASKESFPIETTKRNIVGHAIDTEHFVFGGQARSDLILLAVGRYMPVKNFECTIDVARELRLRGIDFKLRIVGAPYDRAYQMKLAALVKAYDLEDTVQFVGPCTQEEILEEYRNASILIHTSKTGSIDKVVLEAMACGVLPVSGREAYRELLVPLGLYVSGNTAVEYADTIVHLLAKQEDMSIARQSARKSAEETHALQTLSKRLFNL